MTGEKINVAQRAHIYSFSRGGPRGHKGIAKKELNNFDNLMLVCHGCHQKIDKDKDGGRYSVELLQGWKRNHEARVELVTGIAPSKKSHVILYGSNIGVQNVHLNFEDAAAALFPKRYPAADHPIELTLAGNVARDDTERFYAIPALIQSELFQNKIESIFEISIPDTVVPTRSRTLHAPTLISAPATFITSASKPWGM